LNKKTDKGSVRMIYSKVIHPQILRALAGAGHGANIVIADGNFPTDIGVRPETPKVFLNFKPDVLKVPDVLEGILEMIPVEAVSAPVRDDMLDPPVFAEYRSLLPAGIQINKLTRKEFRNECLSPDTALLIQTGDMRTYCCIILTIGVAT